jgi:GNAT superfamily N-acetyltransferase
VISAWERRAWGVIAMNPDNPHSHDSNHAYLDGPLPVDQLPMVLAEVVAAYAPAGIEPRLRYHVPPNSPQLAGRAAELGWEADHVDETWRAWPAGVTPEAAPHVPGLAISLADAEDIESILLVPSEGANEVSAVRHRKVWSSLAGDEATDCVIAHISGEPAAGLACVWSGDWGAVESVRTRERFRRRGICTAMLRFAQNLAVERGRRGLYLYDSDEAPDRIYARAGFELVARLRETQLTPAR